MRLIEWGMSLRRARFVLTALLTLSAAAASAQTATYVDMATISKSTVLTAGRLCATDGRDIYCDASLPMATGGLGLGDRLVSGTSVMAINSATGIVSLTQAGSTWGYLHPSLGFVGPGVSVTGPISGTSGYFSNNVGIGTAAPAEAIHVVNGNLRIDRSSYYFRITQNNKGVYLQSAVSTTSGAVGNFLFTGMNGTPIYASITSDSRIGIGTSSPSATLHVSGTALVTLNSEVRGQVSTTALQLAMASTTTPPPYQCASSGDHGRMMRGGDGRFYLCVDRP